MPDFSAVVEVIQRVTMKVSVEADNEQEAAELILDGDFEEVMDETNQKILKVESYEFY